MSLRGAPAASRTIPRSLRRLTLAFMLVSSCCLPSHLAMGHAQTIQSTDYDRAETLIRNHQWDEGMALLSPLLKIAPRNVKALNLAGLALIGKGDRRQANEYFERALAVNPGFVPALKNLSIDEFNEHQYDLAEKHLLAAAKQSPDDPIVNLYLGEIYYGQRQFKSAALHLRQAGALLSRDPNVTARLAISYLQTDEKPRAVELLNQLNPARLAPQSQFALGLALEQADLPERAIPYLQAVDQTDPGSYDAGFDLVVTLNQAGSYAQAIPVAKDLIDAGHETAELDNVLAEAYEGNKETQLAIDTLRKAIALDPNDDDNYLDFASLCMNHGAFGDGLKVVRVGLAVHPESDRLIFLRGILYAMQDNFDLAEKDFQQAAELAPQSDFGYVGLGVTYIETGNSKQAIQILRQRLREKPDDASLLYLLGEALLKSGANPGDKDYIEAQSALEKSVRLNPNLCLPHVSLGAIYLDQNRNEDAVAQLQQARLLDPKEKSAYSHLAVAYRRLGQTDKAREVLASLKEILDQQRSGDREKIKTPTEAASENASPQ